MLINSPEAVELARDLDKESIVLLENHEDLYPNPLQVPQLRGC
jgi:beta-glucosidase